MKLDKKWESLIHNGVKFSKNYTLNNIPLIYNNEKIFLNEEGEEIALIYAKLLDTEYVKNSIFKKNFFNSWKEVLKDSGNKIKKLEDCDFSNFKNFIKKKKEEYKNISLEEKKRLKEEEDNKYGYAELNGNKERVGNYTIEPPGIFIGRGSKNKKLGTIKRRIYPEDITINCSKGKEPPPPKNHKWGKIVNKHDVEWLASWKDKITNKIKYVWLSSHSSLKNNNDNNKFDLSRKLGKIIKELEITNNKNLKSKDLELRQLSTSIYLILKLSIRVGNEKPDNGNDIVGATNLKVKNLKLEDNNKITLDFLGKDSVPYINTFETNEDVYNNIKEFIKNKDKEDQVFDLINSNKINLYIKKFNKDLSAKFIRTYNASKLFQDEINKIKSTNHNEIINRVQKSYLEVAKIMNHQKNISTSSNNKTKENVDKLKDKIKEIKKKILIEKNTDKINKFKENIKIIKLKIDIIKNKKNMSLETSKLNYIDPRIIIAFSKRNKIPLEKFLNKNLMKKFKWALEIKENFIF